jgi:hypothetical protein
VTDAHPLASMVFTVPMTSRRAVLASVLGGATGLALAGCRGSPRPAPSPTPHPLLPTLTDILALVDLYQATVAAYPDLADRLDPLLADHQTHLDAVRRAMGTPGPTASPSAAASPSASVQADDPDAAVAALHTAEQTGQASAQKACLAAPATYAALIGSIAACRATHVEVL